MSIIFIAITTIGICYLVPLETRAEDTSQYYGYQCKKHIDQELMGRVIYWESSNSITDLSFEKYLAVMNKLSDDGYFWMTTEKQKKDYLHKYMPVVDALKYIPAIEQKYAWHVPKTTNTVSTSLSASAQEWYFGEAYKGYESWATLIYNMTKDGLFDDNFTGGNYKSKSEERFLRKQVWRDNGYQSLDFLYAFWPDLEKIYAGEFTTEEKRRLEQIWSAGKFNDLLMKRAEGIPNSSYAGFTGATPLDDLMWFIPGEKIVAPVGKFALKALGNLGSKVMGRAGEKTVVSTIAVAARSQVGTIAERYYNIESKGILKILRLGSIKISLTKVFSESSIPIKYQPIVFGRVAFLLDRLSQSSLVGKYYDNAIIKILPRIKFTSANLGGDKNVLGLCEIGLGCTITDNAHALGMLDDVVVHETLHYTSGITQSQTNRYFVKESKRYPLQEGFTQFYSEYILKTTFQEEVRLPAYKMEKGVVEAIYSNLFSRFQKNPGKTSNSHDMVFFVFEESYFKSSDGLLNLDRYYEKGFHDRLHFYMKQGKYQEATNYIHSFK